MNDLGEIMLGDTVPASGQIRDLDIYASGPGGVECAFAIEGAHGALNQALTYADGQLAAIDHDGISNITGLTNGAHNIQVVSQLIYDGVGSIWFDPEDGRRVLMRWQASAQNIEGYRIYQVDLDGTNPVLLDTITRRVLEKANAMFPTSGSGTGRISTPPISLPAEAYGRLVITITGDGVFDWSLGDLSGSAVFTTGLVTYIDFGIGIFFHDDSDGYQVGDTYSLAAGPQAEWVSASLTPGNYRYGITAYGGGYESTMTLSQVYEIVTQADPVDEVTQTWDDVTKTLTLAFTLPAGAAAVNLYSNFEQVTSEFMPYVSLGRQANSAASFAITFGTNTGEFRYYLRPETAEGVELQDYTLRRVAVPVVNAGVALSAPYDLAVEAVGALNWRASWVYEYQADDAITGFTVHRTTDGNFNHSSDQVGSVVVAADVEGIVDEFEFAMTTETLPAGVLYIQVAAHGTGGAVTYSDVVTVTTKGVIVLDAPTGLVGGAA